MDEPNTKQRILKEALSLFAKQGYEAVSVAQIAEAVGIKAPSLYKHYKSKKDIFDAILEEMDRRYGEQAASMNIDGTEPAKDRALFQSMEVEQLVIMGKQLFLYFLHDEFISGFRRMLAIEQYHSRELAALYTEKYVDEPLSYQGMLFGMLMQMGELQSENPQIAALHFYAPMFLLLTVCDCHPEREEEVLKIVEEHIKQFGRLYKEEKEL